MVPIQPERMMRKMGDSLRMKVFRGWGIDGSYRIIASDICQNTLLGGYGHALATKEQPPI